MSPQEGDQIVRNVRAQNINTVNRLIILQKNALQIINFKDQLFHSSPLFSENNILKFSDKITLENILSINLLSLKYTVNKSINRQVPPLLYDWFTSQHTNFSDPKVWFL